MRNEEPCKCAACGNEILLNIGRGGRWSSSRYVGGPGQEPQTMGVQWAFYRCLRCGFEGPWERFYSASRELQMQYAALRESCLEYHRKRSASQDQIDKVVGLIESSKALAALPGASSIEQVIAATVEPLLDRIAKLEDEAKRKRGGRPLGSKTKHRKAPEK